MKLKQIEAIIKATKSIIVLESSDCQWLGNGAAFYPVYNLPKLTQNNIFTMFDIPEDKRNKFYFEERQVPSGISFEDIDYTESILDRSTICFYINGRTLEPLKTSRGMIFIDTSYLKPFADSESGYNLYERISNSENSYIAVKNGFMLLGIIAPYDLVNKDFVETLETILSFSKITLMNMSDDAERSEV